MGNSSSTPFSSTTTTITHSLKHEVFLSFRGEDTRDGFTSHLHDALCRKRIETFIDYRLVRGDEISPALLTAIEESKISVVIFSKDYVSSKWCLRELVKILECKKTNGQVVIPVFYHVDPSHVRKQTGSFEDAFVNNHENVSEDEKQKWRAALTEASNLSGFDSAKNTPESKLVDEIIKDVSKKLKDISPPSDSKGLVGIDLRVERVKSLLCIGKSDFEIIGIWGMGGIGKTTIAEAVVTQISSQFEGNYFIANVREESERSNGLVRLREKVLSKMLEEEYVDFGTPYIPQYIKDRLKHKKVLIVLDDVNTLKQLETLSNGLDEFGLGSRIIITTRDRQLLYNYGVNKIYEVEAFDKQEAHQLFCKHAFKQDNPRKDLMVFVDKVVDYAKDNPLALKVVGSSLFHQDKQYWESELQKIGYDGLDDEQKNIFLDIACFFKGKDMFSLTEILGACYFSAQAGLKVLIDKSLLTISSRRIEIHDLLQEMGWEIVRQESPSKPGKRSRLHNHKDIYFVLKSNSGTQEVRGISLDISKMKNIHMNPQVFEKMLNLRFLIFYNATKYISKVCSPSYLPDELRYLCWDRYPSKTLPSSFSAENLVELDLSDSSLEQLWEGKMDAPKLKRFNLSDSRHLTKIPKFSNAPCLEVIYLHRCKSLLDTFCEKFRSFPEMAGDIKTLDLSGTAIEEVPSSIGSLTKLTDLDISNCKGLKHISPNICKLKSLPTLSLLGCSNLESFPEISETMESLEELDLYGTTIKQLPVSIENLNGLLNIDLSYSENLERLPSSICNLISLQELNVSYCPKLDKLPENLGNLKSLKYLNAGKTGVCQLSSSLTSLEKLEELDCSGCRGLTLPPMSGLLRSLGKLKLEDSNMTKIPEDIGCLSSLEEFNLNGNDFECLPESIKQLSKLRRLFLNNCNMLQSLTELPLGLSCLETVDCKQLQSLPDAFHFAESVFECRSHGERLQYNFINCVKLDKEVFNTVFKGPLLKIQHDKGYEQKFDFSLCFPGSDIPDWFNYQSFGSSVNIQLPLDSWGNCKLVGFALWVVLVFDGLCIDQGFSVGIDYKCCCETKYGDLLLPSNIFDGYLTIHSRQVYAEKLFIDLDHVLIGYHDCSDHVNLFTDDYTTCSFHFSIPSRYDPKCKVKCCGVHPIYAEPNISIDRFCATDQDFKRTSESARRKSYDHKEGVEPNPKRICTEAKSMGLGSLCAEPNITQPSISLEKFNVSREFPNEADTSARGSDYRSHEEKIEPHPKSKFIKNNKVSLLHHTLLKGVGLLHCYGWSFLVCFFGGLCIFGLLGLLVLHLSILCEIYLSYHQQNMQDNRKI
ncbi:hypothetical protein ACOSQ4_009494 [Xanthoceras sorbifolium]